MRQADHDPRTLQEIAARVLPGTGSVTVERTATGVSTPVYRLQRGATTLYLRLAESQEANLAPEVLAHQLLRARDVLVPEVVHFEPFNEALSRSLMVTTEIAGHPIGERHHESPSEDILISAGRDLFQINSTPVDGFGWIQRNRPIGASLAAELPTLRAFAFDELDSHLTVVSSFFPADEIRAIRHTINQADAWLDNDQAVLAHGDFDASHIFYCDDRYTGIIDFGEIRGADQFHDLGYFALHDGEQVPFPMLQWILAGYRDGTPLPLDASARIALWSLILGIRSLSRSMNRPPTSYQTHLINGVRRALHSLQAQ